MPDNRGDTSTFAQLRQLCGEFNAGAYMRGPEPDGMSKDDALEWATQIIDHVPALLDVAEAAQAFAVCRHLYSGRPEGWTCLDSYDEACSGGGRLTDKWRTTLTTGERLCDRCRMALALRKLPQVCAEEEL